MRINDILIENKQVTEAPLGMLSKIGNNVKSAFGSGKSKGILATGNASNKLKQDYMAMLGSTGQEAEADNLIAFLQKAGYPVDRVKQTFGNAQAEPVEPTMDPEQGSGRPQGGGKVSGKQSQTPSAVAKRNARRDTKNAAATTGGAGAFNQAVTQLTTPSDSNAKAAPPADTNAKDTPPDPNAKEAPPNPGDQRFFNPRSGMWGWKGTSGGFTSDEFDTPAPAASKALGPKGRETLGRLGKQSQVRSSGKQGTLDLNSRKHTGSSILEALSDKQIDAAFLMAVQDKAKSSGNAASPASGASASPASNTTTSNNTSSPASNTTTSNNTSSPTTTPSNTDGISLKGINITALKVALTNVVKDRPVDNTSKQEIQKLLRQI
jgi:hypothetical protein